MVERLRTSIPENETCSAGVAFHESGEPLGALMGRADNALYEAKQRGRNRTVVAPALIEMRPSLMGAAGIEPATPRV